MFILLTVQTHYNINDLSCDLTYVIDVCNPIRKYVKKGNIIIVESTISLESMEEVIMPTFEEKGFNIDENLF